ncbi:MAG TPA: hypothetical protein VHC67_18100 [Gaiellaceae bacterium]|nr:hypothetical protein [Gaiellaceae bacterium]
MRRLLVVGAAFAALWCAPGAFASTWCGTGSATVDRPDVVTGQQIHAIVALPADAPDTFVDDANHLQTDVDSINAWWVTQDATREPRWDVATYPGGSCLDISFVRLPDPTATYSVATSGQASTTYQRVGGYLRSVGYSSSYKDYLVYVDGFGEATDPVCGTGAGDFDVGGGFAMVWLRACGVPTDAVAAHEVLHELGALPAGAPHPCPGDSGHPCDSPTDVLYPYASGGPLTSYVLDFNHDDYYAHSGTWNDIQDSFFMHLLGVPSVPLNVALSGGAGDVKSDVPGVDCTAACTTQWDPQWHVDLTASPSARSRFLRWSGACAGAGDCALTLDAAKNVTAVFGPKFVPVRVRVSGKGAVACAPRCSTSFLAGSALRLTAHAAKGWKFTGWSGACKGKALVCRPVTDYALSAHATFKKLPVKKKPKKKR